MNGLIKTKDLGLGIVGEYWDVIRPIPDRNKMTLLAPLELFKDASYAQPGNMQPYKFKIVFTFTVTNEEITSDLYALSMAKIKEVKDTILHAAVLYQAEIPEVPADPDNNILGSPAIPERAAKPAIYKYPDLVGATDAE